MNSNFILGNASGDMDSIASSLALAKAYGKGYVPILNICSDELYLRKDVLYLFEQLNICQKEMLYFKDFQELVRNQSFSLFLIDHNRLTPRQEIYAPHVVQIIDHHQDEHQVYPHLENKIIAEVGSCSTLVTEVIASKANLTIELAYLLLAPLLLDTNNLSDPLKTTARDIKAANLLKKHLGNRYDSHFFKKLMERRLDVMGLSASELLKKDFKIYRANPISYGIASLPKGVAWTKNNEEIWKASLESFLSVEKLAILIVLEWIGDEKGILLYTNQSKEMEALLSLDSFNRLFASTEFLNDHTVFRKLKDPLARKVFQPLLDSSIRNCPS